MTKIGIREEQAERGTFRHWLSGREIFLRVSPFSDDINQKLLRLVVVTIDDGAIVTAYHRGDNDMLEEIRIV